MKRSRDYQEEDEEGAVTSLLYQAKAQQYVVLTGMARHWSAAGRCYWQFLDKGLLWLKFSETWPLILFAYSKVLSSFIFINVLVAKTSKDGNSLFWCRTRAWGENPLGLEFAFDHADDLDEPSLWGGSVGRGRCSGQIGATLSHRFCPS